MKIFFGTNMKMLDWRTDYDKFVEKDGKWWYNGRANDDFLIVKQGV